MTPGGPDTKAANAPEWRGHGPWFIALWTAAYLLLVGPTIGMTTIQYDEFTDIRIASELSVHPLQGSPHDGSQARLPMYVTAVAMRLLSWLSPEAGLFDALLISRWLSVSATVVAIWATAVLGTQLFGAAAGVLAAGLFALSPFTLHFGRDALTQGDAFTAATVTLSLLAFRKFQAQRSTVWLAAVGVTLGLAIASKFTLAFLIPSLIAFELLRHWLRLARPDAAALRHGEFVPKGAARPFLILAVTTGFLVLLAVTLAQHRFDQPPGPRRAYYYAGVACWLLSLVGLVSSVGLALRDARTTGVDGAQDRSARWPAAVAWLAILPLAAATTLALFPEHIFNPEVLPVLLERFATRDGNTELLATATASAKLYAGVLLLKLGLPLGICTLAALAWATHNAVRRDAHLLLVVVLGWYAVSLLLLPLQQPFWLLSVYPLVMILLAGMIVEVLNSRVPAGARHAFAAAVIGGLAWLAVGIARVYPTFGYFGYETAGERWLGEGSRGFRSLVVVTNDGSSEALEWLGANARTGSLVLSYLNDVHLLDYLMTAHAYPFDLRHALRYSDGQALAADLERAEFVVVRTIDDQPLASPTGDTTFIERFGTDPMFRVVRGRGVYRMILLEIYRRRESFS